METLTDYINDCKVTLSKKQPKKVFFGFGFARDFLDNKESTKRLMNNNTVY